VPALAVQGLQDEVTLVREDERLGRHPLPAQRGEELQTLIDGHAEVPLVRDDERGRRDPVGVKVRRPLRELLFRLRRPGGPAEIPVREPQFFGHRRHGLEVEDAVVRDRRLETAGVAEDPVHRVAAVAGPRDPLARRVHERHLHDGVEDGVQVDHDLATPVAADLVHEFLAEARRPARVRRHDDPALCGPQALTPAERPPILPRALRAAVDEEDDGIFLRRVEGRRLDQPVLHARAARSSSGKTLGDRERDFLPPRTVLVGQCLRLPTFRGG
jgi:hypothetical protein